MQFENSTYYVDINKVRTDYPVIDNLSQFLAPTPPQVPKYHPDYVKYWSKETKKCIEGVWGKEFGKWRYMPGSLYFFGSFTVLEDTKQVDGVSVTKYFKPLVVDYYWEFAAQSWTAYGFAGFTEDTQYTCHRNVELYEQGKFPLSALPSYTLHEGKPKKYVDAFEYLLKLHDKPLGKSLFQEASDSITLGTRRGGKSYWVGLGELEYNFVFGGARRYDQDFIDGKFASRQLVGSTDTTKSKELYDKFEASQMAKLNNKNNDYVKWFGIITETYIDSKGATKEKVTPCPFYKKSSGNLDCPNKTNPYRAKYKVDINGEWVEKGTGSELVHVNYSTKKADGAQAGVGGAYLFSDAEEVGLVANILEIKGSNDSATKRNGFKFGVQHSQGTSGNIEQVQETKKLFLSPTDYGIVNYRNKFSEGGNNKRIGYFIPNYMIHFDCKDKNGNTDYKKAIDKVNRDRQKKFESKDPKIIRDFVMNEPCYVEEMWYSDKGFFLPYEEASERERDLMKGHQYKNLGLNVELYWDEQNKTKYRILHEATPMQEWPMPKELKDPSGCVVIYEKPIENAPHDLYLYCCDPYVEEDLDKGGSLASTYVIKNPKYVVKGITGNIIVASYIGKPSKGLDYYYEQQEKLINLYGNTPQGLWYDARGGGETLREYYIRKGKQYLLCIRPGFVQGDSMMQKNITVHGCVVGNRDSKKTLLKMTHDWLLEETEFPDGSKLKNIFRIPCIFLIRQIMAYDLEGNFDAVSSFMFGVLGLREMRALEEQNLKEQYNANIFEKLLSNSRIFKQDKQHRSMPVLQ